MKILSLLMRPIALLSCLLVIGACGESSSGVQNEVTIGPEVEAVRASFESYREALLARDGQEAVKWVTESTVEKYGEYRDLAIRADRRELQAHSFIHRFAVLAIRVRFDLRTLKRTEGAGLFILAVEEGLISEGSVARQQLRNVVVVGETASAEASTGQADVRYTFARQEGRWRLDFGALLSSVELLLKRAARAEGLSEDEAIFEVLEAVTGRTIGPEIWEPLE